MIQFNTLCKELKIDIDELSLSEKQKETIKKICKLAYEKGESNSFFRGYSVGSNRGYEYGYAEGYDDGFEAGYDKGRDAYWFI